MKKEEVGGGRDRVWEMNQSTTMKIRREEENKKKGKKSRVQERDVEKEGLYFYAVVKKAARAGQSATNCGPTFPD